MQTDGVRAATSRSTSRWASTRSCGSSTSRARARRDHLVVSVHRTDARRRADDRTQLDARRAALGTRPSGRADADAAADAARAAGARSPRRPAPAPGSTRVDAWQARARRACSRPRAPPRGSCRPPRSRTARPIAGAVADDPGLAKDAAATSSCRRGTRAATAPRSGARCTRCCRPSTSRPAPGSTTTAAAQAAAEGVLGHEDDDRRARARRARQSRPCARACAAGYWRETYVAVPARRHHARGLRRPRVPRRPTASSSSTTRPTRSATTPTSPPRLDALPRPGRGVRARGRARRPASRSTAACSCFLDPDGAREVVIAGAELAAAVAEVARLDRGRVRDRSVPPARASVVLAERLSTARPAVCHPGAPVKTRSGSSSRSP